MITKVKVVTGDTLALLDTTGTLTQKYQARLVPRRGRGRTHCREGYGPSPAFSPTLALNSNLDPVQSIPQLRANCSPSKRYSRGLGGLVGESFPDRGYDQERNRGAELHRLVCEHLEYGYYQDDGHFPDVRHQLLEVKLQTSPTIDLGLICPDSMEALDVPMIEGRQIRHCDVRYALFYAEICEESVTLTHFFLTTGERFFSRFPQFQGKVLNKKLQIPLPADFFERETESLPNQSV